MLAIWGEAGGIPSGDRRSARHLARMGDRRAGLCHRQRSLSGRGDPRGDRGGAGRVLRRELGAFTEKPRSAPKLAAMTLPIDRQATFSGIKPVAAGLAIDEARLDAYLAAQVAGLSRPARGAAVQGRAVEPDLSARDAGAALRAAPQAARQAAAVGARGRPRIPRHLRAARAGLPGRRAGALLRRRERRRHRVLRDGLRRRAACSGSRTAGIRRRPSAPRSTTR